MPQPLRFLSHTSLCKRLAIFAAITINGMAIVHLPAQANETISDTPELEQQAITKTKQFAADLKKALMGAIQEQGFPHAVDVCKEQAPAIAKSLSTDGWQVARTSLKVRNQHNAPDAWETQQLTKFDQAFKSGVAPARLVASHQEGSEFRFMKAIPTGQLCLACHGKVIDEGLSKAIKSQYPNDQATGFTLQDIRGAFSLTKIVD